MAYTLKTTGIATKLIACIGVDDDGTTVKDFVTGNTGTHNASIAPPLTGVGSWKGASRSWFKVDASPDQYTPRDWSWTSAVSAPMGGGGNGITSLVLANSIDATTNLIFWLNVGGGSGMRSDATSHMEVLCGASVRGAGTTPIPAATKCAFGFTQKYNTAALPMYFGLESGSLAEDGTYAEGGFASTGNLVEFGGDTGDGSAPGSYYLALYFSATTLPTTAELQALHDDPFGVLFEAPASFDGVGVVTRLRLHATPASGVFGTVYRITGTLVDPSTGLPRANLTGIDAAFFDQAQPSLLAAPVQTITNLSTNASGVFTWDLPGSALIAGQTGLFVPYHAGLGYLGAYLIQAVA